MDIVAASRPIRALPGLTVGTMVGAGAAWLAMSAAALGHGSYVPAALLFPYSMILAVPVGEIAIPLLALALIQYPAYGAVISLSRRPKRTSLSVVSLHAVAAVVASLLILTSDSFR